MRQNCIPGEDVWTLSDFNSDAGSGEYDSIRDEDEQLQPTLRRVHGQQQYSAAVGLYPEVFEDFSTKEELLTLLPLKTTTRGVDIYNAVKEFFVQTKVALKKLVAVTTDGAPAMIRRYAGFIAHCKGDPDFPKLLHYHCIIHQQALCAKVIGFGHVTAPVVKIINSIRSKAKQHRIFKVLLEEMSAEYGNLLLHTEIRWLSKGLILLRFVTFG
ncbi:hypothetical protein F2P81_013201 [Scophthalmus maximus]|uniref:SCAN domain-containing protein 3-like n=1 Tax=Scophthalmus maximus TaxID=52904 RepID=A0A6A4SN59_SCOMX|nr:hypothetical protein F2P81_013201 [Scophthalmus maximus]